VRVAQVPHFELFCSSTVLFLYRTVSVPLGGPHCFSTVLYCSFTVLFLRHREDSTGIPHILEHSVLCGSRRVPREGLYCSSTVLFLDCTVSVAGRTPQVSPTSWSTRCCAGRVGYPVKDYTVPLQYCFSTVLFLCHREDSTGIPHILEHSVLCGSRKYPVKEPFVELIKGSLHTFLNAFTYPDRTCYPVASTNLQVRPGGCCLSTVLFLYCDCTVSLL